MPKKFYTILIVSQKAAQVKKLILSPLTLKITAVAFGIVIIVSAFIVYDYVIYKKKVNELHALRGQTRYQQVEIQNFMSKITVLEEQLNKLKEVERQMEKDLKEVNALKKAKRVSPAVSLPQKTSKVAKIHSEEVARLKEEQISILEEERPRMVSRLHQDLLAMRKEAFQSEQNLKELQKLIQAQKSILEAIPSLWPVFSRITSRFGDARTSNASGGTRPHQGVDIACPVGTPVLTAEDGVVSFAGWESEYGRMVVIDHGKGFSTIYGHLKEIYVEAGNKVKKGHPLGSSGLTGNTTGPHLHYEVRIQGNAVNPSRYLNQTS